MSTLQVVVGNMAKSIRSNFFGAIARIRALQQNHRRPKENVAISNKTNRSPVFRTPI